LEFWGGGPNLYAYVANDPIGRDLLPVFRTHLSTILLLLDPSEPLIAKTVAYVKEQAGRHLPVRVMALYLSLLVAAAVGQDNPYPHNAVRRVARLSLFSLPVPEQWVPRP
jgi:hypothetical protein